MTMKLKTDIAWVIESTPKGWPGWLEINNCSFDNAQDAIDTANEIAKLKPDYNVRVVKKVTEREVVG